MHTIIHHDLGRILHATVHPDLNATRATYAFIPELFFNGSGFQRSRYLASQWPSINAGANPHAIGKHIFPHVTRPVNIRTKCPILREFLNRLETIATSSSAVCSTYTTSEKAISAPNKVHNTINDK